MTTLSAKYAKPETRNGIKLNKTYSVPIYMLYIDTDVNVRGIHQEHVEYWAQCWINGDSIPTLDVTPTDKGIRVDDGQHRTLGARLANERGANITHIDCRDFNGDEIKLLFHMIKSSQGKALDPIERANGYLRGKALGLTNDRIAELAGRSVSDVQTHLAFLDVPEEVKQRVVNGEISYANAVTVTREHGDDAGTVIEDALRAAKASGKNKVTNKQIKKSKPSDRLIELISNVDFEIVNNRKVISGDESVIDEIMEIVMGLRD